MSGIEIAGLVFGVLPVLVEAIKSYSTICDSLRTFRRYSKEVRSISQQSEVQKCIFLNHCRLLLRLAVDENAADAMMEDENDQNWRNRVINDSLSETLKDNLDSCQSTIEMANDILEELKKLLGEFNILEAQKQKGENIGAAIKRLRKAVKVTFNKSRYQECLADLRDRNDDLNVLRSQISSLQESASCYSKALIKQSSLPDSFHAVQKASEKLHEALCDAWCCDDTMHRAHFAKLCLDVEVGSAVRLDLAISCLNKCENADVQVQEAPIWLYVQSLSVMGSPPASLPSQVQRSLDTSPQNGVVTSTEPTLKKKASSELHPTSPCSKKTEKRVRFNELAPQSKVCQAATLVVTPEFNLCQTTNICRYLQSNYKTCKPSLEQNCLGYLETSCQMYRHKFYLHDRNPRTQQGPSIPKTSTVYSIFDAMQLEPEDVLEPEDQLKLALKMALSTLQYNNTPWLTERWRLNNMSYFGSLNNLDDATLKTLHLSSQISLPKPSVDISASMEGVSNNLATITDEMRYGINNLPLFFLGVALLEIAHWKPLEKKMTARDEDNPVYTARRLAEGRAPLGPEYQKIAQKCLQCNFGFGTKLSSKSLQTAVYNDVVCGLEGIIERLAIN